MFIRLKKRRATTLIELLITITIFSIVAVMSGNAMMNTMQSTKRIQSQVFLYTEAQTVMDQLARAVERNTIDYETYYAREVQLEEGWHTDNYGYYGQSFYDPGTGGPTDDGPYDSIGDYDAYCANGADTYPVDCPSDTPLNSEQDIDTGQHPFVGIFGDYATSAEYMNAMCEDSDTTFDCDGYDYYITDQLILINGAGDERTVFAREEFDRSDVDFHLSKVQLMGEDTDNDGIVDDWTCVEESLCTGHDDNGNAVPRANDLTNNNDEASQMNFMPITPSTISIEEFYVIVAPNDDPYRAFAEADMQIQPQATIIMTVTLSDEYGSVLGGELSITFQRTVSTGVYSEVVSYE